MITGLSCTPVYVSYVDQDSSVDLSDYKTFGFKEFSVVNETALEPQEANFEKIKNAIRRELQARGFTESESPELLVNIGVTLSEGIATRETTIRDAPVYIGQRNYRWESEEIVVDRYEKGTVVVDIVDAAENSLIWEGVVEGVISANQNKIEKRINLGMEKIFKKFSAL